jgi:endonuclease YncB( thermonuclease family)
VFLALAVLVTVSVDNAGWLSPETGRFTAIDGDSLRMAEQEYRLHGIDAPELQQSCTGANGKSFPCGRAARDHLRGLVRNETLQCDILETDRYGRLVAECRAGTLDINREMVRSGWAIAYRRHGTAYQHAESSAREAARGIWQGRFDMPERWRQQHRGQMMRSDMSGGAIPDD